MAAYHLLTIWRIEAPLEDVYTAVQNSLRWPAWWPGVKKVEQLQSGQASGIDSVWRYCWQGNLPYQLVFDVRATRIEPLLAIEGSASGDLEGTGRWLFSSEGAVSVVRYEWQVRSTRWWMNLIAPLARPLFIRNHARLMAQGAAGLACWLDAPLLSQESRDLLAETVPPQPAPGTFRQGGRIDLAMVLVAGLSAGVLATLAQLVLWWLAEVPLIDTLLRDARLTAALLMGQEVLPPPTTGRWDILLVASFIHFALSLSYALLPAALSGRWRIGPTLLAGAFYGLLIYGVNLYGLTWFFPWFAVSRDWVTLLAHLVFGISLSGACLLFARCAGRRSRSAERGMLGYIDFKETKT